MILETHSRAVVRELVLKTSGPALSGHQQLPCTMQEHLSAAVEGQPSWRHGGLSESKGSLSRLASSVGGQLQPYKDSLPGFDAVRCDAVFFIPWLFLWKPDCLFFISNFCPVLNVVFFLLGDSPASEFYTPRFREQSVRCIFIGGVRSSCLHHLCRWDTQCVPKRRDI